MNEMLEIKPDSPIYPQRLLEAGVKTKGLYAIGNTEILNKPSLAIVGSRKCTSYGSAVTKEIVRKAVSRNIVIVSGMARGIDSLAQKAALEFGGETIAVLGTGVDVIYPKENRELYEDICRRGLVVSEYPPGTQAERYNFPNRNRIISGLSDAVVIVEAMTRSGSLITAECAIEQGRPVYAVPGNITSVYSMGTNKLIRDGASALVIIDDLFLHFSGNKPDVNELNISLGEDEKRVLAVVMEKGISSISEIAEKSMMDISMVNSIVTILEIKGMVFCEMGKVVLANFI